MMSSSQRRTRVTIRCVVEDLGLELPPLEVDIASLEHPLVAEARRLAPNALQGQKRIRVSGSGEEVWVAIATQATDGRFVEERLRDVLFGLVLDAADAELWEPRADWPGGELAWFEVARLGLRELPS
jgi:hypothetical protein